MSESEDVCYDDTPFLPGSQYRVHGKRPVPRTVQPGGHSSAGNPPSDAVVLFDGSDLADWTSAEGGPADWKVENGYMEVAPGKGDIQTKERFSGFQLHLEWAAPEKVVGDSQKRGNSGVFLMGLYEIQVLDSYENPTYPDGQAAAIYGQFPPLVNACLPPGYWQSYDIIWKPPVFDGDKLLRSAYATVLHNGVLVHHHRELLGATSHKTAPAYEPHPGCGPLKLQDHGDPVRFRNIWIRTDTDPEQ